MNHHLEQAEDEFEARVSELESEISDLETRIEELEDKLRLGYALMPSETDEQIEWRVDVDVELNIETKTDNP